MDNPIPTDEDRKNYEFNLCESQFYQNPEAFLKLGQRVRAKFRVWDLPGKLPNDWGWVSAEAGELGTVVHVQEGCWPTVRFDGGRATCVTDLEVEPVEA